MFLIYLGDVVAERCLKDIADFARLQVEDDIVEGFHHLTATEYAEIAGALRAVGLLSSQFFKGSALPDLFPDVQGRGVFVRLTGTLGGVLDNVCGMDLVRADEQVFVVVVECSDFGVRGFWCLACDVIDEGLNVFLSVCVTRSFFVCCGKVGGLLLARGCFLLKQSAFD